MEFKEFKPRFKSAKTRFKGVGHSAPKGYIRHKSWNIWYNFKWNQPYLSRGLNLNRRSHSLNSATGQTDLFFLMLFENKSTIIKTLIQDKTNIS